MRHIDSLGMPRSAIHEVGIAVARKLRRPLQLVSALAFACIYGSSTAGVIAINGVGALYNVSTTDATLSLIGNTGIADWGDIQFAPNGTLYGFTTGGSAALYRINPATAAATLIGSLGLGFVFEGGLAFSPSGTAYGTNGGAATNAQLFTLNLATGAASIIGTISGGSHDINGLTWRSDGVLIGLDDLTNALLLINPLTATSSSLAPVSSPVGAVGGMTQTGGLGYFATDTSPSSSVF